MAHARAWMDADATYGFFASTPPASAFAHVAGFFISGERIVSMAQAVPNPDDHGKTRSFHEPSSSRTLNRSCSTRRRYSPRSFSGSNSIARPAARCA